ncbi:MAG: hypothetical protein ACKOEE_08985, partial [Tagaea sp.]
MDFSKSNLSGATLGSAKLAGTKLKHEFEGFGVDPAAKRELFDRHLAELEAALRGRQLNVPGAAIPIQVAVLRKEAAYHVGRAGRNILCVPYASVDRFEEVGAMAAEFARGRAEAGKPADADAAVWAFHTYVAETDEEARAHAAEAFDLYVATRL